MSVVVRLYSQRMEYLLRPVLFLETSWLLSQESKYIPNYPLTKEFGGYTGFHVDDDDMGVEDDSRFPNLRS